MRFFTPGRRYAVFVVLFGLTGCTAQCNCTSNNPNANYVAEDTPQGRELKAILEEQRRIIAELPPGLPLQLEPVVIDVVHSEKGGIYRPKIIWTAGGGAKALQAALQALVAARKPDLGPGKVTTLALLLRYRDQQQQPCGSEKVVLDVSRDQDSIVLSELGKAGSPFGMRAELDSATWLQEEVTVPCKPGLAVTAASAKGVIPLEAPAGLPIVFAPLPVEGASDPANPTAAKALGWQVANREALQTALADRLVAKRSDLHGRRAKSLALLLSYKDKEGRPCGTDRVELDLTLARGWVSLPQFSAAGVLASTVIEPVAVTWLRQSVIVPLGE